MNRIIECLEFIKKFQDDPERMRNIRSSLDHDLKYMTSEEMIDLFKKEYYIDYMDLPIEHIVYFVALTEYIYNLNKIEPPEWVNKEIYIIPTLTYTNATEKLCEIMKSSEKFKELKLESAIPEFVKRNYVICDVMSAV